MPVTLQSTAYIPTHNNPSIISVEANPPRLNTANVIRYADMRLMILFFESVMFVCICVRPGVAVLGPDFLSP